MCERSRYFFSSDWQVLLFEPRNTFEVGLSYLTLDAGPPPRSSGSSDELGPHDPKVSPVELPP